MASPTNRIFAKGRVGPIGFEVHDNPWIALWPELWLDPDFVDARVLIWGNYRIFFGRNVRPDAPMQERDTTLQSGEPTD